LCRQVARTVGAVLAGECDDDLLRDLLVESVDLAPGVGRLFVTVALAPSAPYSEVAVILERLQQVQGRLRSEVASAITRRKAPDLIFRVRDVPPDQRA
jgi:ribosome-binding factor A